MRSLTVKLILAFLAVSLTSILLVAALAGRTTADEFGAFSLHQADRMLAVRLAAYYEARGSWEGIGEAWAAVAQRQGMMHGRALVLADEAGRVIVPGQNYRRGETIPPGPLARALPVEVDGRVVGHLLSPAAGHMGRAAVAAAVADESDFLSRINRVLILASLGAALLSLILAVTLAQALTRPLRELTEATRAVAQGDLGQKVTVRSRDELGELAQAFNQMSHDLARSQEQRRQMTADIAHDLRTPLSLILGHAEALRDGVLSPTQEALEVIHDEAERLNRLVEDLRTLSLAEAGELLLTLRPVAPALLLERAANAYRQRARQRQAALRLETSPDLAEINVDPDRIGQVLANLLDNALRHTPPGGEVWLKAENSRGWARLTVQDSGPGIEAEALPRIFERFYRADKSRQRGGSGLGLAIARSIVEAHHGRIWAENAPGRGARFCFELPLAADAIQE